MEGIWKLDTRAPLDRSPKKNWVEERGGLPMYIRRIANHLHAEKGMDISHAIAVAVNAVKKMCATGDVNWPGAQQVNAGSRAEACAAVADWERKKVGKVHVSKGLRVVPTNEEIGEILVGIGDAEPVSKNGDYQEYMQGTYKCPNCGKRHKRGEKCDTMSKREEVEFEVSGEIEKADAPKQMIFGWAQVAIRKDGEVLVDKQGDYIDDPEDLEDAAYDFVLESRDGGEMHVRKGVSRLVESFVSTVEKQEKMGIPPGVLPVGWWVGYKIDDPAVWEKVEKGEYRMFSVHGRGVRKVIEDA